MEHVPGIEARVVQPAGVVSNISTPPGLLMSDVHVAESCAGAAMVLEHTNEAKRGRGPTPLGGLDAMGNMGCFEPSTAIHCHPLLGLLDNRKEQRNKDFTKRLVEIIHK